MSLNIRISPLTSKVKFLFMTLFFEGIACEESKPEGGMLKFTSMMFFMGVILFGYGILLWSKMGELSNTHLIVNCQFTINLCTISEVFVTAN